MSTEEIVAIERPKFNEKSIINYPIYDPTLEYTFVNSIIN